MDRERLRDRADKRVRTQVESGLVRETELLLDMGYDSRLPALSGFGYREMVAHLGGKLSLDQAISAYQMSTRQFIRRQMTWFRSDPRIRWFDVEEQDADSIAAWVRSALQDSDS
jgi:tRNA dimethylallyltransferase